MDTTLPTGRAGRLTALGILVAVLGLLWMALVGPLIDAYGSRADRLAQRQAQLVRMERLAALLPELRARAAAASDTDGTPTTVAIEGPSDAVAAATLQNMVQDMANGVGANLSSIEIVPAESVGAYRRIGLKLNLDAPWPTVVALLKAIDQAHPPMLVDDLEIHSVPAALRGASQNLDTTLTVYALRAAAPTGSRA